MVALVLEVTVTVTTQTSCAGVLVMVKLVVAVLVLCLAEKKAGDEDPSTLADTTMVTPLGGIVEVTVTARLKSGPGAIASVAPF